MKSPKILRKPVTSSNIKSIGYDEPSRILEIEFVKGSVYQYSPVTAPAYQDLIKAPSIGKHFHTHIKSNDKLDVKQLS